MSLREVVLRAADIVDERGLNKGGFTGCNGSVCLMGALAISLEGFDELSAVYDDVVPAIRWAAGLGVRVGGRSAIDIIRWNDAPERTKEDVSGALRKAAGYL